MNDEEEESPLSPREASGHFWLIESSKMDLGAEGAARRGGMQRSLLLPRFSGDANLGGHHGDHHSRVQPFKPSQIIVADRQSVG